MKAPSRLQCEHTGADRCKDRPQQSDAGSAVTDLVREWAHLTTACRAGER